MVVGTFINFYTNIFFNHLVFTMLVVVININYKNSQRTTDRAQLDVQSYFSISLEINLLFFIEVDKVVDK